MIILIIPVMFILGRMCLSIMNAPPPISVTSHIRNGHEYYFHANGPKDIMGAVVSGTSCESLKGSTYYTKRHPVALWDWLRHSSDWKQDTEGDRIQAEKWKQQKPVFNARINCIPYVKDLKPYLEQPADYVDDNSVALKNGPILAFDRRAGFVDAEHMDISPRFSGPYPGTYIQGIAKVYPCGENPHQFCADMPNNVRRIGDNGKVSQAPGITKFTIICWSCDKKLLTSAEALKHALLYQSGSYFVLDGGYMEEDKSNYFGDPEGVRSSREEFDKRTQLILSLIDKEAVSEKQPLEQPHGTTPR